MTQKDSLSFERASEAGFLIALGVVVRDIVTGKQIGRAHV